MYYRKVTALIILFLSILPFWQSCTRKTVPEITLPEGKTAQIVFVVGDVFYRPENEAEWIRAEVGASLTEGTRIKTDADSYCELVISSGTIFRMKDRSELQLVVLPKNERENRARISLITGDLFTRTQKLAYRSRDTVVTDKAAIAARQTEFLVHTEGSGKTEVLVAEGVVRLKMNVTIPSPDRIPAELKAVMRKIDRGISIREGYKIEVTEQKIRQLDGMIGDIVQQGRAEDIEIERLKQEIQLESSPLDAHDRERLKELDVISLEFETGDSFYLSPNFDGINDEFVFSTEPFEDEKIHGWKLVLLDGNAFVQKVMKNRKAEEGEDILLPERIVWNMVNLKGNVVNDGDYVYEFYTSGKNGVYVPRVRGTIAVDTVPPSLIVHASEKIFSPNDDGVKDTIAMELQAERGIEWLCTIMTSEEIIVRTIEWGRDIPDVFEWDGKGENGTVLPEGVYDITISGQDSAGNVTKKIVPGITLDVRERQATVDIDNSVFSPNGDGVLDSLTFYPILSDRQRIDTWDLIVQTEKGDTAKRIRGRRYMPRSITWDGKPQKDKMAELFPEGLPSGRYTYFLKVIYTSGVNTYSFKKELILDNDPPEIEVAVVPSLFSPDGDGKNDTLVITPKITDLTAISNWEAAIYSADGMVFKTFSGTNPPAEEITWDGISDTGSLVDSGEDYYLQFKATDTGYNTGRSGKIPFSIDILVIQTERGLKIRVSNVEFGFNTADLKGDKTFDILDKIVTVLAKYEKYSIIIEGHTDSTGNEDYNLALSKRRAESVGAYLVDRGIDGGRLSYEGYGSQFPIDTNRTKEGRKRNRRVEFILIRK